MARAARALGLGDAFRLLGRVDHDRVPELLAAADICLDPAPCSALNHRSTMIKIAEYMAAGRPIVSFDLVETRHTAEDAALYAECADRDGFVDQITRLAGDEDLRRSLAGRALVKVPELMWDRSEEALLEVYRRLASGMTTVAEPV